ncbi:HAD-like domain-containing protein [Mycena polygramma]|nr:HAD-like domain-containing protein [Mycena polygramma]
MSAEPIPESTLPYPPVYKDKRFVVLTDWDGTITTQDSNDYMTDNLGYGKERRRAGNLAVLEEKITFRDAFREMLESVSANGHTLDQCKEELRKNIKLDTGFADFNAWCRANDVPVVIVSSGMAPVIRAVLSKYMPADVADSIDIIANDVDVHPDGKWDIKYRHPTSGFGHDKSRAILPYKDLADPPVLFFFGDGVSDMSAARHADLLFVKLKAPAPGEKESENDLAAYCTREGIRHVLFREFGEALAIVKAVVAGERTVDQVLTAGGL